MPSKSTLLRTAALAVLFDLAPADVRAGKIYIDYLANPTATVPSGVFNPTWYGWVENYATGAGSPVINDAGLSVNAWRVNDNDALAQNPNPSYVSALSASAATAAISSGFRFEATARYVSDFDGAANMGLSVYLNRRAYHLMLDLNAAGDLQATLHSRSGATALTSGGTGTAAFYRFSLESSGGTSVTALFNGQPIGAAWTGVDAVHDNIVLWGNSNQSKTARGTMDFKSVSLELGPFNKVTGDFDGDADVDAGDLLVWQRTLGSTSKLAADANGDGRVNAGDLPLWKGAFGKSANPAQTPAPEPEALILILSASGLLQTLPTARRRL